jgi:hypothetical protein
VADVSTRQIGQIANPNGIVPIANRRFDSITCDVSLVFPLASAYNSETANSSRKGESMVTKQELVDEISQRFHWVPSHVAAELIRDASGTASSPDYYVHSSVWGGLERADNNEPGYSDIGFYGWEAVAVRADRRQIQSAKESL